MTPKTNALIWRALVKNAATFVVYLDIDDEGHRQRLEQFYHISDITTWARERIEALLERAANLLLEFEDDEQLADDTRQAASASLDLLKSAGYDALAEDNAEWMF